MGWEDRPYYRDRSGPSTNPLMWLLTGSVPLFTAFGVRVRAHVTLLMLIVVELILDQKAGFPFQLRAFTMATLASLVILHEFGHVFACRWVGGTANDILLWPLGGLAMCDPPRRPLASFITVAGGPAVNLLICILCAAAIRIFSGAWVHLNPFDFSLPKGVGYHDLSYYLFYIYLVSYGLFLLNVLLPIYPLDGGQMWQAILWPWIGYYRSMMVATMLGMVGSVVLGAYFLISGNWMLAAMMVFAFYNCYQMRMSLRETGPEEWQDSVDYHASIYGKDEAPKRRRTSGRAFARARRIAQQERDERNRIDTILAKVSASGMQSLTWLERRTLRKATERQRRGEVEFSRFE
jgi:Zn-dependent protease